MATSNRLTLPLMLENSIRIGDKTISFGKIFIPRIQRSYAQGRKRENEVRSSFLKDIFKCLSNPKDEVMELSFIFGSKQPMASGGKGFELLDGQQRITTLFLLHWYLWMKERQKQEATIPDYLKKLTYETRDTSTQFIDKIVDAPIPLGENKPSKVIKSRKWFTDIFNCDPTVCSMLNMLDDIDKKYKDCGQTDLYDKLDRLQFYVLYLEEFELNDELYIKMNSRGLDLTPFENFKSALIRYMKKEGGSFTKDVEHSNGVKMPYYLRFSTKMDTAWNDIFWTLPTIPCDASGVVNDVVDINNTERDARFFRFFIRYFFTKLILKYDNTKDDYKSLEDFFYNNTHKEGEFTAAESDFAIKTRLMNWDLFMKVLDSLGYEGICKLEHVLDVFANNYGVIRKCINDNPYKKSTGGDWDVFCDYKDYTLSNRVVFASITEFIENIPAGTDFMDEQIQINLRKMCRVMWNVIENSPFDNITNTISHLKTMGEIINLTGAVTGDFYAVIANNQINSRNAQLDEEIVKAKKISDNYTSDPDWEEKFVDAEKHSLFKGMVRFFFEETIPTSSNFEERYNVVKELFDEKGITQQYRNEHILIRALVAKMNQWGGNDGLRKKSITENAEKENYLKIILRTKGASELFLNYFNNINNYKDIKDYFCVVTQNATWNDQKEPGLCRAFKWLVKEGDRTIELYNQMAGYESSRKKCFQIAWSENSYLARIPYNERIVLDSDRYHIFDELINNKGFDFEDKNQRTSYESPLKEVWGGTVSLYKVVKDSKNNDVRLIVCFDTWKVVKFYIEINGSDIASIENSLKFVEKGKYQYITTSEIKDNKPTSIAEINTVLTTIENAIMKL